MEKAESFEIYTKLSVCRFEGYERMIDVKITDSEEPDLDTQSTQDTLNCDIWDIIQTGDGMFILVDHGNDKLKRLDSSYALVDSLTIEGPRSVCEIRPGTVAVGTLWRLNGAIQIVDMGMTMTFKSLLLLNDTCRGFTFAADSYYVCHSNYIGVYTKDGEAILSIKHDDKKQNVISSPWDITKCKQKIAGRLSYNLYISDTVIGIVVMNLQGIILSTIPSNSQECILQSPRQLCAKYPGHVYVCDVGRKSIIELAHKGVIASVVLHDHSNCNKPKAVCCDWKTGKLLVSYFGVETMFVYDVNRVGLSS